MAQFDAIEVSLEHVAELLVGDVRKEVWAEDIKQKPFRTKYGVDLQGYRGGDEVGNWGIESSMEDMLRGTRGQVVRHRNGDELESNSSSWWAAMFK